MKFGIVGFSFGLRSEKEEPGPSNLALAHEVVMAMRTYDTTIVVTQWEITKGMKRYSETPTRSVELHEDGTYLDSKSVWKLAKSEFDSQGVRQVVIIAQPFLHLPGLRRMIEKDEFEVVNHRLSQRIPFDNSPFNTQPWTRNKIALVIYAIKSIFGVKHGHKGMQNVNKNP